MGAAHQRLGDGEGSPGAEQVAEVTGQPPRQQWSTGRQDLEAALARGGWAWTMLTQSPGPLGRSGPHTAGMKKFQHLEGKDTYKGPGERLA